MKAPKPTREERIRTLEKIVMIFNDRIKNLESIIYNKNKEL
jgi:chaperonin cofactor prefoldin